MCYSNLHSNNDTLNQTQQLHVAVVRTWFGRTHPRTMGYINLLLIYLLYFFTTKPDATKYRWVVKCKWLLRTWIGRKRPWTGLECRSFRWRWRKKRELSPAASDRDILWHSQPNWHHHRTPRHLSTRVNRQSATTTAKTHNRIQHHVVTPITAGTLVPAVLMATSHSYGNGQTLTTHRIWTP